MPSTAFRAAQHGFHFGNDFVNQVLGPVQTKGLCGGMSYAALDYFKLGRPIPADTQVPDATTSPLEDYIFNRQLDSFYTVVPLVIGASGTGQEELFKQRQDPNDGHRKKLLQRIDEGKETQLLLIGVNNVIGGSHQVLCYGYEYVVGPELLVYNCGMPGEEVRLRADPITKTYQVVRASGSVALIYRSYMVDEGWSLKDPPKPPLPPSRTKDPKDPRKPYRRPPI